MSIVITERTFTGQLVPETCCTCGIHFGLPADFKQQRLRDGNWWSCPNGHSQHYSDTTEARLRRELEAARVAIADARADYADEAKRHSATKGQLTRTRKRADAGVCQHCHRTFANVARHVAHQHRDALTAHGS